MRYALFTGLLLAGALATAPRLSAQGGEFPSGIRGRQASQVVGQMLDLRAELILTDAQVRQLSALQASFRAERSQFRPGPKTWHAGGRPVTSNTAAYRQAAAILTPVQRAAAFRLLDQVPIRATAAATSDPLVHHAAGIEAPPARQGSGEPLDPLLHDTGKAPAEQPESGSKVMTNPVTHRE
jgi:hypothetical protein